MNSTGIYRPSFFQSFNRAQVSSAVATAVDFGLLFLLVEIFHVWYVAATASGAALGALTNFLLNRHWSFAAFHQRWARQALRYSLISGASLLMNTGATYGLTEFGHLHYSISVLGASIAVGIFFNFPLHRYYVFK